MRPNGIFVDVISVGFKGSCIQNPCLRKAPLPECRLHPPFDACAEGETAFHKLDCAFDRHARINREQQMKMVGHDDERMQEELSRAR